MGGETDRTEEEKKDNGNGNGGRVGWQVRQWTVKQSSSAVKERQRHRRGSEEARWTREVAGVPELVGRPGWNVAGAAEDLELLAWVGRFRFVTAELAAVRLGLTVQRARARGCDDCARAGWSARRKRASLRRAPGI